MTAGEVVERIKANVGVPWRTNTFRDTFKAGGPDTVVTGIATTVFASFEVVQRAVAAGLNMIVPHEVTYWNDRDDVSIVSAEPLYEQKREYLARNNVVIFRMHDHMSMAAVRSSKRINKSWSWVVWSGMFVDK